MMKSLIAISIVLIIGFTSFIYISHKRKQHAKNEKLNFLYNQGLQLQTDPNNPFYPEGEIDLCDSILATPAYYEQDRNDVLFVKAVNLLYLGKENQSVEILEELYKNKGTDNSEFAQNVIKYLALAYQRLGERNNCFSNHCSGSCIFPIQGMGIYSNTTSSLKSIKMYSEILKQNPNDLEARWLLNIVFMTLGKYPREVPSAWLIPGLDRDSSSYSVKPFINIGTDLGMNNFTNMAGGVIVDDFNNDDYLDIITSAWGLQESMHYFRNNADGTFTDISKESGIADIKGGLNIIQADYNNDGFTDVLVLRGAWWKEFGKQPNTLLKNNGDGTFTDVTVSSGLLSFHPTQTAVWADFNNDGWIDLFIGNETSSAKYQHPCELYINNRNGSFTNDAAAAGCELTGYIKGVTAADYNNDGWPDIFVSNLDGKRTLLKNNKINSKIPQFTDVTHDAGLDKDTTSTFPTWFWDYNNDGWPDIFVCGYQFNGTLANIAAAEALNLPLKSISKMYLYKNNHDGSFTDVSESIGLNKPVFAMGCNFGDIDNDGWLDMYLGTGNPDLTSVIPNRMFKNIGGNKFEDVTYSARVGNLQKGHGVAFADIDNDGDQDIFEEVGGAIKGDAYYNSSYENPGQSINNFISLTLEGAHSNRSAIGARIALSFNDSGIERTVYSDINSGGSFGASPFRKEIGIGKAKKIDKLTIKWPGSDKPEIFTNISANQFIKIKEGSQKIQQINIKILQFKIKTDQMQM